MSYPESLPGRPDNVPQSIYVIGDSRTNVNSAITKCYGAFYAAFEIDEKTEQVLAFDCSHTLELTLRFLQDIFVGQHFPSIDNWLEETLERRYGGTSRRALLVSYRVALHRYLAMKKGEDV